VKRAGLIPGLALLAVALLGCAHTKTTDLNEVSEPPKGSSPPTDQPPPHVAGPAGSGAETTGIPVASSPEGLLAPGGEQQIRDKLIDGGYLQKGDTSVEAGLRKLQKARDLPETGMPDHQTVKALGLDPDRIFRHADVKP